MTYILESENLTKEFNGITALKNVNLKIPRGAHYRAART